MAFGLCQKANAHFATARVLILPPPDGGGGGGGTGMSPKTLIFQRDNPPAAHNVGGGAPELNLIACSES